MKIDGISNVLNSNIQVVRDGAVSVEKSFGEVLNNAINEIDQTEQTAKIMTDQLAIGEIDNPHDVFIATQKAELTLNMALEVKNKVVEAYKEIMRLQL